MNTPEEIKLVVENKYAEIVKSGGAASCCEPIPTSRGCTPGKKDYTVFQDDYSNLNGYVADADLGLGCGLPTEYAGIKKGDIVVDLGSGAGNDVFVARAIVGEEGKVIGVDMTGEMIDKANNNNLKLGYDNVEFKLGDIEKIPLQDNIADVVVSNCVLNLVPDKHKAFSEVYRILKPGAHFCVSDIVVHGEMTEELKRSAELYTGCISGALQQDEYLKIIENTGFKNIEIKKTKKIELSEELLSLNGEFLKGIFSITVVGYK